MFRFEVPYTWNVGWKPTYAVGGSTDISYDQTANGLLRVEVVNALRQPSTAADHIDILVFVSAGEDFQLAFPHADGPVAIDTASTIGPLTHMKGEAQSGDVLMHKHPNYDVNASTFGEAFTGYRQWLKRYMPYVNDAQGSVSDLKTAYKGPFFPYDESLGDTNPIFALKATQTPWLKAEHIYRFKSGSLRQLYVNKSVNKTWHIMSAPSGLRASNTGATGTAATDLDGMFGIGRQFNTWLEPVVEHAVPYYQMYPALVTGEGNPPIGFEGQIVSSDSKPFSSMPCPEGTFVETDFFDDQGDKPVDVSTCYRAAGEDFCYGYFIGVPVTWIEIAAPT